MIKALSYMSVFILFFGCATVFKGSSQSVTFNSHPEGAQVIINGNVRGRTPMSVNLKKNKIKSVLIRKEGYITQTISLDTSYDATALWNIFWDSSTTDLLTGNAWEYQPDTYSVQLQKDTGAKEPAKSTDDSKPEEEAKKNEKS